MTRRSLVRFETDLPDETIASLEQSGSRFVLAIEVAAGRVVAATLEALARLGIDAAAGDGSHGHAPSLDASMPALARIRAIAATDPQGQGVHEPESLLFWGREGALRLSCRVRLLDASDRRIAVVSALDAEDALAAHASAAASPDDALSPSLRASLAHELKTPVSAIAAAAEIMKDQRFGPLGSDRYVGYAADIHGSAHHILGVIERMLDEARTADPLSSADGLAFAEIDPGNVLRAAVSQIRPLAERSGIRLALDLAPRLPHIVADTTSLRQIVFNLLTNALKFTARGGQVTVAARYDVDGPLTIAISDTGAGMTRREIDSALSPTQAPRHDPLDVSLARGLGLGLGLGLPLVQALAAANGAELVIESAPGKGTSASVLFGRDRVIPV